MTTKEDISGGTVDQLLLDAGHSDLPDLRAALLSIASLAQMRAPAPGPELAAMLAGPRDETTRQRWLRRHRPAVVGLAVLAGMGLGVSGVAATSQASGGSLGPWSVQQLTSDWTPGWTLPLPPGAARDRPAGRIPPLFLQLDRTDPSTAQVSGKQATPSAGPDSPVSGPPAPTASGREQGVSAPTSGVAAGAASHGISRRPDHGQVSPGNAVTGHAMAGSAPDQAAGEDAAVTPPKAGETADAAPSSDQTRATPTGWQLTSPKAIFATLTASQSGSPRGTVRPGPAALRK
jgi:hypothetical protein